MQELIKKLSVIFNKEMHALYKGLYHDLALKSN